MIARVALAADSTQVSYSTVCHKKVELTLSRRLKRG